MLLDISHQKFDRHYGDNKGYHTAQKQVPKLASRKGKAEPDQLQKAGAEHNRNRQQKGKLCRHFPGHPDDQRSNDRRP